MLSGIEDDTIREFANANLDNADVDVILELCNYESEVLAEFITKSEVLFDRMGPESITPQGIIKLAQVMLKIDDSDSVLDGCSGLRNFLVESICNNSNAEYTGIELNHEQAMLSKIRFEVMGKSVTFIENDLLSYVINGHKFTKIFSNYPFGIKARFLDNSAFWNETCEKIPALSKSSNSDWLFNYRLTNLLADGGKSVAIMAMGGL